MQTVFQEKFNNLIVQALLYNNLPLCEKERKLQQFVNESEERYDSLCENIYQMCYNKTADCETDTLYITIEGYSFVSTSFIDQHLTCFPVLTINQYSPRCPDISAYIEIVLNFFASYCDLAKNATPSFNESA